MESSIIWDTTSSSPLKFNRRFGGIVVLHLLGRFVSQARSQHEAGSKQALLNNLHLRFPPKVKDKVLGRRKSGSKEKEKKQWKKREERKEGTKEEKRTEK
jgi:hypothetical protein